MCFILWLNVKIVEASKLPQNIDQKRMIIGGNLAILMFIKHLFLLLFLKIFLFWKPFQKICKVVFPVIKRHEQTKFLSTLKHWPKSDENLNTSCTHHQGLLQVWEWSAAVCLDWSSCHLIGAWVVFSFILQINKPLQSFSQTNSLLIPIYSKVRN
jgi:hypothetical protein